MILQPPANDDDSQTYYRGEYHPYRVYGSRNPAFNARDGLMLDLKQATDSNDRRKAIAVFTAELAPLVAPGVAIATVPSHEAGNTAGGLRILAAALAAADGRVNANGCLVRHTTIPKLAKGGDRSIDTHLNSIRVDHAELIRGREVLLLDDVMTSGNSLAACKQLLIAAGATRVLCLALGRTTH